jgi:hypothetical protein
LLDAARGRSDTRAVVEGLLSRALAGHWANAFGVG